MLLRIFGYIFGIGAFLGLGLAIALAVVLNRLNADLPNYEVLAKYEPPVMTRIHAADGQLVAEHARERRLYLPIQAIPDLMKAAFLSAEDKNFYAHPGIDPEGVIRAVVANVKNRGSGRLQGASTITQQVAKNFLLTNERTMERKIKEALLALRIEQAYSKDKIFELYLNEIYLGLGNYGVAAAALNYFGKSVHELSLAEAAYMAALPKAPNNYHPFRQRQAANERRNWVLDRMVDNGYIKREEAEGAKREPLNVSPRVISPNTIASGYFAEEVRREIADRYGEKKLYGGGLSVRATLDPKLQAMARKALTDGLVRFDEARGYRGAQTRIDLAGREWGTALAEVPALGDVQPWRLAVVLEASNAQARIGLQPKREASGQ